MSSKNYKKRKHRKDQAAFISSVFRITVILVIPIYVIMMIYEIRRNHTPETETDTASEALSEISGNEEDTEESEINDEAGNAPSAFLTFENLSEQDIYTFLQGPVAWNSKTDWSGEWCEEILGGQKFSVFGCGLCDLANIYSTLTPFECSPVDMFYFARDMTDYSPTSNYGAIAWDYMQETLEAAGIYSRLHKKDETYEEFQQNLQDNVTAIVLISSANDNTYWKNHIGHYVNIWLYDREEDTVFLADSGNPDHNRQRIPLRYVYNAMNTADTYQYLLVNSVNADANQWQHDGIDRDWTPPDYYHS